MKRVRYLGQGVFRFHDNGAFKQVWANGVVEVSDARAEKLELDYPDQWEDAKGASVSAGDVPKPTSHMPAPQNKAAAPEVEKVAAPRKPKSKR